MSGSVARVTQELGLLTVVNMIQELDSPWDNGVSGLDNLWVVLFKNKFSDGVLRTTGA